MKQGAKEKTQERHKDAETHTFTHMEIPVKAQNWKS